MILSENQKTVLATVRKKGVIAINDIVENSTLSSATGSRLINKLIAEKFLIKTSSENSIINALPKGRPQKYVQWHGKSHYAIGLDIGTTSIKGGIIDLNGSIYKEVEVENNPLNKPELCFEKINDIICRLSDNDIVEKQKILGVGIAFAGLVNKNENIISFSPAFNWHNIDPMKMLSNNTGLPIYFDNVTRVMALGEIYLGEGKNFSNFVYINIGYGIGASVVINGNVYKGTNGYAGEFGHVLTKPNSNFECSCGQKGCLTTTSSGEFIAKRAINRLDRGERSILSNYNNSEITAKKIFEEAEKGDELCISVIDVALTHLAYRLVDLERIIDPEAIIIGGGITFSEDYFFRELRKKMDSLNMKYSRKHEAHILPRTFAKSATIIGAGILVAQNTLNL